VLGSQGVHVTFVAPVGTDYALDLVFQTPACALTPRVDDLIVLPNSVVLEVFQAGNPPSASGAVSNVLVKLLAGSPASVQPSTGEYRAPYDPFVGVPGECFLGFSPDPLTSPATGVASDASIVIGFDEPMLPRSLSSFEGIVVRQAGGSGSTFDNNVMAVVTPGGDLQDFSFDPLVEFDHVAGSSESYTVQLTTMVTDLAGNQLAFPLPISTFTLSPAGSTKRSGSLAFTFSGNASASSAAVDDNGDGYPEFRGQFIHDVPKGEIRPRPVDRFSGVIDENRCSVSAITWEKGGVAIIDKDKCTKCTSCYDACRFMAIE
jgi:NAD-dependent dihydropyrimidine dehydrogenase PreA subunit